MPAISIIIPVYNAKLYVRKAIDSLLCQTFQDYEIFLIDDGSIDGTENIVREIALQNHQIHLIQRPNK